MADMRNERRGGDLARVKRNGEAMGLARGLSGAHREYQLGRRIMEIEFENSLGECRGAKILERTVHKNTTMPDDDHTFGERLDIVHVMGC